MFLIGVYVGILFVVLVIFVLDGVWDEFRFLVNVLVKVIVSVEVRSDDFVVDWMREGYFLKEGILIILIFLILIR